MFFIPSASWMQRQRIELCRPGEYQSKPDAAIAANAHDVHDS
jgi:hypothetical protein